MTNVIQSHTLLQHRYGNIMHADKAQSAYECRLLSSVKNIRLMDDGDVGVEPCVVVIHQSEGRRYERRSTRFDVSRPECEIGNRE